MNKELKNKMKNRFKKLWDFIAHHNTPVIILELILFTGIILVSAAPDAKIDRNSVASLFKINSNNNITPNSINPSDSDIVQTVEQYSNPEESKIKEVPPGNYVFNSVRNYERIEFSELRKTIDPYFNQLADQLSDAYYNYWKRGLSKPFRGYDVKATPEESKVQFDKLHGLIFMLYDLRFHSENLKQPLEKQIPQDKYNVEWLSDGVSIKKTDADILRINQLKTEGIELKL